MKYLNILAFIFLSSFHGKTQEIQRCDTIPTLNLEILKVLEPYMGKKILRGECWDVLSLALNQTHANWNGYDVFGKVYDYKKQCISPGDLISFKNVKFGGTQNGMKYFELMEKHFAIVKEVKANGELVLLHQNTGKFGKKLGESSIFIGDLKKGKMTFFHPEN
ncbi:hypothetical protein [Fluviicola taffensis]|uniref:BBC1/AIM3 cysteine proteinase-fold domain-containing protein n=1 Tax=Fluviicola taffensis (strain DSM 16823 / NCIMB 13979 / RW262) TaxID=755732 RepID=F2IFQ6_FLUTR|nr:hypothetical protein [Fluviicola taffensis]AEA42514.1 hypothetical protein Fluta_0509 [Fluviicola taffensis DSM 16823]